MLFWPTTVKPLEPSSRGSIGATTMAPPRITGLAGGASGRPLRHLAWEYPSSNATQMDAASIGLAKRACGEMPRCDVIEISRAAEHTAPGLSSTVATLRASFTHWLQPQAKRKSHSRAKAVLQCKQLAAQLAQLTLEPYSVAPKRLRRRWNANFCNEYTAASGEALPALGARAPPIAAAAQNAHCPTPSLTKGGGTLHIFTYANRRSRWLCAFMRSMALHGATSLTILGWNPSAFVRTHTPYYFADRMYTWLRYLIRCKSAFGSRDLVMLCDNDQLLTVNFAELGRRLREHLRLRAASIVFAAEKACMPRRNTNRSWAFARTARPELSFDGSSGLPFCVNGGDIAGTVDGVISLLNDTSAPFRQGLSLSDVFERFSRAYTADLSTLIFDDQWEISRRLLHEAPAGWSLDYENKLFHVNDGWKLEHYEVVEHDDGSITNRVTRSERPPLLHYNGISKVSWRGQYSMEHRIGRITDAYNQGGDADAAVRRFFRERAVFVVPDLVRDARPSSFESVCGAGVVDLRAASSNYCCSGVKPWCIGHHACTLRPVE